MPKLGMNPSRSIRRGAALCATVLAVGVVSFANPTPAEAHQVCQWYGRNWGCVSTDHHRVSIHDEVCNNRYASVQFVLDSSSYLYHYRDNNGCVRGGVVYNSPSRVVRFRICEDYVGCTRWTSA